jgi:hypothetical protein
VENKRLQSRGHLYQKSGMGMNGTGIRKIDSMVIDPPLTGAPSPT